MLGTSVRVAVTLFSAAGITGRNPGGATLARRCGRRHGGLWVWGPPLPGGAPRCRLFSLAFFELWPRPFGVLLHSTPGGSCACTPLLARPRRLSLLLAVPTTPLTCIYLRTGTVAPFLFLTAPGGEGATAAAAVDSWRPLPASPPVNSNPSSKIIGLVLSPGPRCCPGEQRTRVAAWLRRGRLRRDPC